MDGRVANIGQLMATAIMVWLRCVAIRICITNCSSDVSPLLTLMSVSSVKSSSLLLPTGPSPSSSPNSVLHRAPNLSSSEPVAVHPTRRGPVLTRSWAWTLVSVW